MKISKELQKLSNEIDFLEELVDTLFNEIVLKRIKDIRLEIRLSVIEIIVN